MNKEGDEGHGEWKGYTTECIHDTSTCKPLTVIYNPAINEEHDHFVNLKAKNSEGQEDIIENFEVKVKKLNSKIFI